jgi:hypothetical protein
MIESRRRFLAIAGLTPIALIAARESFAQAKPACYDMATMPLAQRNMRRSVGFVDPAPEAAKRCGTCAFFVAKPDGCGSCQILSGGPVSPTAFCTSYAPKA